MIQNYKLEGKTPVPFPDTMEGALEWARWYEEAAKNGQRHVAKDTFPDGTWVSTVFLGINHNHSEEGPPILFETMIFDGPGVAGAWDCCERYSTWEEAEAGHRRAVELVKARKGSLPEPDAISGQ